MPDANAAAPHPAAKKGISREEHRALLNHHIGLLAGQMKIVDEARQPFDAAKERFTELVNDAKGDLGKLYSRKYLMSLLEDRSSRLRDLMLEEARRFHDRIDLGLPVYGTQQDLFGADADKTPAAQRDAIYFEAEGYLVGRRGGERKPPEGCPPEHDQAFLRGYDRGQDENGRLFVEANELKKRLAEPAADQAPVNLQEPDEDADLDEAARQLKRSGFMQTGADAANEQQAA